MVIENKTEYTWAVYRRFHRFFTFRRRLWLWVPLALAGLGGLLCMALDLLLNGGAYFEWRLVVSLLLMVLLAAVSWFWLPRLQYRSVQHAVVLRYRFDESCVHTTTTGRDVQAEQTLQYTGLQKVLESRSAFYLFVSGRQAYIVEKAGFSHPEDEAALRQRLQAQIKKYKIYT